MSWEDEDTVIPNIVVNPFAGVDEDANVPDSWDAEIDEPLKKQPEEVKKVEVKAKLIKKDKLKKKQEGNLPETELEREILAKDLEYEIFKDSLACNNQSSSIVNGIDDLQVQTKEDFEKLKELLKKKILPLEKNPNYSMFLENTFRDLVISSDVETLKKFSIMFSALANEKSKVQKTTGKKKKTIKGAKLATVRVNDVTNYEDEEDLEFDEDY